MKIVFCVFRSTCKDYSVQKKKTGEMRNDSSQFSENTDAEKKRKKKSEGWMDWQRSDTCCVRG